MLLKTAAVLSCNNDKLCSLENLLFLDKTNREILDAIDRSLFVICIEDPLPINFNHRQNSDMTQKKIRDDINKAMQMLYGGGSKFNSSNRWFDQVLQVRYSLKNNFFA